MKTGTVESDAVTVDNCKGKKKFEDSGLSEVPHFVLAEFRWDWEYRPSL